MPSERYHELCGQIFIVRRRHYWWLGAAVTLPVFFIALVAAPLQLNILYTALIAAGLASVCGALSYHFFHRLNALKELQDAQVKIDTLVDDHTRYVAAIPARLAQAEMALHALAERLGRPHDVTEIWHNAGGGERRMLVKYNVMDIPFPQGNRRTIDQYGSLMIAIHADSIHVRSCLKAERIVPPIDPDTLPVEEFQPPEEPQQPLPL